MHEETTILLIEVGALLFLLGLLGRLGRRIGLSPIPLYLLAGLVFGHGGVLPLTASEEFFAVGAEIGVILLLVMLGLEYSAGELVGNLRSAAPAGLIDGVFNALPGAAFAFLLGWDWVAAIVLAGITWVSSSGVIAKVLADLGRLGNRETPVVLSVLVIEDLAMALYLPLLTAVLAGTGLLGGGIALGVAVGTVMLVLVVAIRYGHLISSAMSAKDPEALLLGVLGLTLLVAGVAAKLQVSAAVGAFLVGIALSGPVAHHATEMLSPLRDLFAAVFFVFFGLVTDPRDIPPVLLPALALAVVTMGTKTLTGYLAARRVGIKEPGRWRAGLALVPRGEFSIVIAGLAVAAGSVEPKLAALATAYVLITVVTGPMLARLPDFAWFKLWLRQRAVTQRAEPLVTTD
ncbi:MULTISPECIES: cation:proton antiporter [Micromonospora]|jgi:CPA2 family monovalent cation:H+ antiporter-2|uniref:Cation:proton antiporter n=1 Tax=Micromonospora carbonacea TaxID=47853 RepID=A0A7H8XE05_9ACTN|nr:MULTISPECIES: cation:proton antiporter [Micromonospora]MBB5829689.1 CPA2 family monovalent cation:H+ antiporter-2 [Micromonospora carbonacea]QLD22924.1 cation:proton antiporter [Micromonospora carbonacea]WFE58927.1 cation:proton antiporter [Micromonospora sp. WMMD712]